MTTTSATPTTPSSPTGLPPGATLRPATHRDVEAITAIWHRGWRDGHLDHVPAALVRHRRPVDFRRRVPERLGATTVATVDGHVVGFVMVVADEVEQLYVDAGARGTGVAAALLTHGEAVVARAGLDRAWLAVVAGNARARRFYQRQGWSDRGEVDYPARTAEGTTLTVPAHRYEKDLASVTGSHDLDITTNHLEGGQGTRA